MSVLKLKAILKDDLMKRLTKRINIEDWIEKCSKCGYPKLIHKNLHRDATCTRDPDNQDALSKNWEEYTKRIKPILKALEEEYKKDI